MIGIIYGAKGSGKTSKIIDSANAAAIKSKGSVLYLTDRAEHSKSVDNAIRFVDVTKWAIAGEEQTVSFIKGLLAGNYDVTDVFVDGILRMAKTDVGSAEKLFEKLDAALEGTDAKLTVTITTEVVPDYMKRYL